MSARMVSGFGQFHSNEATAKTRKAYSFITWPEVTALVDTPQQVPKGSAQWLIPSTLPSRCFLRQGAEGEYWMLWGDLDKAPPPLQQVTDALQMEIIGGSDFEVFSSRSATAEKPKARILIPLGKPLRGADWVLCQEVLNDQLEAQGIAPDRVSERTGQLCFLPNRGAHYEASSQRSGIRFDPLKSWATEIAAKRQALADKAAEQDAARKAAKARREAREAQPGGTGGGHLIDAFNDAYRVDDVLLKAGYAQRGDTYCHPASESGSYSASVKDGRVHSLSSSDPLYTGGAGGGAHDAFSAFTVLMHGGDEKAALRDAGDTMLMIGGESWNTVKQREWIEQQQAQREQEREAAKKLAEGLLNGKPLPGAGNDDDDDDDGDDDDDTPPPSALVQAFGAFIGARKAVSWAVQNMIQRGYIYSLTARWGHGKTAVTLPMGMHVACGTPWAGFKVQQTRVLYMAGENPDDVRLRALQAAKVFGMDPEVLAANMFFTTRALNLTAEAQAAVLLEQVSALDIGVCFVDTGVAHSAMEEENSNAEMHELAVALRTLSGGLGGAAVVCLMHPPKASSRDTLTTRGGGAFAGEIDGELLLWQDDSTKQVELFHGTKLRGPGFEPVFFELQRHEVEGMVDNFGDTVQTVVAVPVAADPAGRALRETPAQRKALQTLMQACRDHLARDADGHLRGVHVEDWRTVFYSQATADTQDAKRQSFRRVRGNLQSAGLVSVSDDFYLPTDAGRLAVLALMKAHRDTAEAA